MTRFVLLCVLGLLLGGCASLPTAAPAPTTTPTTLITQTAAPTETVAVETGTPGPTPTLHPLLVDATLPALMKHTFRGGAIRTSRVVTPTGVFTTSIVSYSSDGISISGVLNVPQGPGPFPAIVLVHGYVPPDQYTRGLDTRTYANDLASHGYVTLEPDLRGFADSGHGQNVFLSGFIIDTVNAANALKTWPTVDPKRIGLWGHSMGAGVATRTMLVTDVFSAAVLYAPLSDNMQDMFMDPFGGEPTGVTQELIQGTILALDNQAFRDEISPRNFWEYAHAPVSIHVGSADDVTPPQWAQAIRDGLEQANKPTEYFEYDGEGHTFRGAADQAFKARVLDFFGRTLK